jgi:hypothetical protein
MGLSTGLTKTMTKFIVVFEGVVFEAASDLKKGL